MFMKRIISINLNKCLSNISTVNVHTKCGHILGIYESDSEPVFTNQSSIINKQTEGKLEKLLQYGEPLKESKCRVLYGLSEAMPIVAVVGLRKQTKEPNLLENLDEQRENVRSAIAAGCSALMNSSVEKLIVDDCNNPEAAAEGAYLSLYKYDELKSKKYKIPALECFDNNEKWERGRILADGQNVSRRLMEMPANILTPTNFAQEAVNYLEKLGVEVRVRTKEWAQERKMFSFLSVSKGSSEPPVFLDIKYSGAQENQSLYCIVGKGVTFDTGGISLKPSKSMDKMKGDMGGAACTIGSLYSIASLKLPINVRGFIPLCENMPGGAAIKPGDVIVASNGKSIQIDNTDAEGRLILADALHYASQHNPEAILDMATLTGAINVALGAAATGVFSTSENHWQTLYKAGFISGDRVWRMPLYQIYTKMMTEHGCADINNISNGSGGGACSAAAFLKEFVSCKNWMHLDIAGVMENKNEVPYLGKGMSGRPTRTIVEFFSELSNK